MINNREDFTLGAYSLASSNCKYEWKSGSFSTLHQRLAHHLFSTSVHTIVSQTVILEIDKEKPNEISFIIDAIIFIFIFWWRR